MHQKYWLAGAGALALAAMFGSAQASTLGSPGAADLRASAGKATNMQEIAYRRCWWRQGVRHCRWYDDGVYGYRAYRDWEPRGPDAYATGSTRWWREMDREDRGGFGSRR